jgi:hypothetical protein
VDTRCAPGGINRQLTFRPAVDNPRKCHIVSPNFDGNPIRMALGATLQGRFDVRFYESRGHVGLDLDRLADSGDAHQMTDRIDRRLPLISPCYLPG